jgi:hypothetical protein
MLKKYASMVAFTYEQLAHSLCSTAYKDIIEGVILPVQQQDEGLFTAYIYMLVYSIRELSYVLKDYDKRDIEALSKL